MINNPINLAHRATTTLSRISHLERLLVAPEIIADPRLYKKHAGEFASLEPLKDDLELLGIIDKGDNCYSELVARVAKSFRKLECFSPETCLLEFLDKCNCAEALRSAYVDFFNRCGFMVVNRNKWVFASISGIGAYSILKQECGVHKFVGGIKAAVKILVHPVHNFSGETEFSDKDIRIDTFCSSGAGGQHINKTESAVRATHLPTNTSVVCQDERSQIQNKASALDSLKLKVIEHYANKTATEIRLSRSIATNIVGRGELAREYNTTSGATSSLNPHITTLLKNETFDDFSLEFC